MEIKLHVHSPYTSFERAKIQESKLQEADKPSGRKNTTLKNDTLPQEGVTSIPQNLFLFLHNDHYANEALNPAIGRHFNWGFL